MLLVDHRKSWFEFVQVAMQVGAYRDFDYTGSGINRLPLLCHENRGWAKADPEIELMTGL